MNLQNLTDQNLLEKTAQLVQSERDLLTEILHHLREIERRRLFSQLGYNSLFEYATKKLAYSDDQAARRISAMRLLKELPQLEPKITSGSLTLTNLNMAQTLFRQEQKRVSAESKAFSSSQKLELLSQLEHKSKRQAEKILAARSSEPAMLQPDRIRVVSETTVEIKFMAQVELQSKIEKVKGLLAHSHRDMKMTDMINWLCDMAIQKLDPAEKPVRKSSSLAKQIDQPSPAPALKPCVGNHISVSNISPKIRSQKNASRQYISASAQRQVWKRAGSRCQNCGSLHALQVDHLRPIALGGTSEIENLRILCRSCNQRAAINLLGLDKMERYLDCPSTE